MKHFLALAITLLLVGCAVAQNTKSNAVWVGVSVNLTNGTVSPPVLEQRIAEGGGVDTNAFIPKWPAWYQFSTNADWTAEQIDSMNGIFYGLGLLYSGLYIQRVNAPIRIRSIGTQSGFTPKDVILEALHGAVRSYSFNHEINSTNRPTWNGAGLATTNDISFDPVPVFTNGTAPGLVLSNMSYSTYNDGGFAQKPGVFWFGDYGQLTIHGGGLNPCYLTFSEDQAFVSKDMKAASFTLGTNTITEWPTGGGGLSGSRVITANSSVSADDYIIWLDTRAFSASNSVTLTLPDMAADSQTIVLRRLGNDGAATIARGTNTWTLAYDGDGVTVDWLGAATNWYWRAF